MFGQKIDGLLRRRFIGQHGEGEPYQYDFYRCDHCGRLYTWNLIRAGTKCCAGHLRPTNPLWYEVVLIFLAPWKYQP